jgi:hypothetical protein
MKETETAVLWNIDSICLHQDVYISTDVLFFKLFAKLLTQGRTQAPKWSSNKFHPQNNQPFVFNENAFWGLVKNLSLEKQAMSQDTAHNRACYLPQHGIRSITKF